MIENQKIIKSKIGLLKLAEELGSVSQACRILGFSRDTFYRYKALVAEGGLENLVEKTRRKANLKNRVDDDVEAAVVEMAVEYPAYGQMRVSNELRKKGIFVSAGGVRCIWLRHELHTFARRLAALDKKVQEEGIILTEAQVAALEKQKLDDEALGEIDTAHNCPMITGIPGLARHVLREVRSAGVGRVYQQTFVDTYSKVAFAKLYTSKTPITAADVLNDRVIPFLEEHQAPLLLLLRVLTDRGSHSAASGTATPMSCFWPSMTSNTPKPGGQTSADQWHL